MERLTHERSNGIKTGYWNEKTKRKGEEDVCKAD